MTTLKPNRSEYMSNYNKTRKNDESYMLVRRLNNKLSYLRKHHNLTDDNEDYKLWKLLYPEFLNITETLNNINIINSNSKTNTDSNFKERLHALIDEIII